MLNCLLWTRTGNSKYLACMTPLQVGSKGEMNVRCTHYGTAGRGDSAIRAVFLIWKNDYSTSADCLRRKKWTTRNKWAIHSAEYCCTPLEKSKVFTVNCLNIQFGPQVQKTTCMDHSEMEPFAYSWDTAGGLLSDAYIRHHIQRGLSRVKLNFITWYYKAVYSSWSSWDIFISKGC